MISAALAVPPLVSTTTGRFGHGCGFASRYILDVVGARPRVSTTSCPGSRNSSLTATPWSSKPPGLPRRSSTSDFIRFWTKPFTACAQERTDAVNGLVPKGMKGLVLDLRGIPGGLLDQGVAVSELFLDPGQEVVETRGRAPTTSKTYRDAKPQPWPHLPVVVLTNGGTASAAEIITGALQDHDRALVVGTPTFGKGLVQSLWQLTPETALKLTTARCYTPSGRTIQRKSKNEEDQLAQAEAAELGHDSTKVDSSLVFHTEHGRVVMGGGGIRPDLFVVPDTFTTAERGFIKGLGNKIPTYWDVRTAYALEIKTSGRVKSPDFSVTLDMADEVIRRLRARGVAVPDSVVAGARNVITQDLGYEIARYVFGRPTEVRRQREEDRQVRAALALARRAKSPQDLLALAAAQTPALLRN